MSKRKQRSSPYPSYTIENSIELVTKIYNNFGSGNYYAKREEIAEVLNISSSHLQTQVSSANQYGLLELKQGEGYKPSDLFVSIYRPYDENGKSKALIDAFQSPALYNSLIDKFEGEILPSENPLANILLHHHYISDGANKKAASIFIENVKFLNLLSEDNTLSLNQGKIIDEPQDEGTESSEEVNKAIIITPPEKNIFDNGIDQNNISNNAKSEEGPIPFNIPLKNKRKAQIIVPSDVRSADFDFIINFINLMRQQFE